MSEWRDIGTAPRDGTHILVCIDFLPSPTVLFWNAHIDMQCWENPASGVPHYVAAAGGWKPTHWMPLPSPPERES